MIIAIDGMDGAGKTTVAQFIQAEYGFKIIEKPNTYLISSPNGAIDMNIFNNMLENIYKTNDPLIKTWFFALGNMLVARLYTDQNIIIDRHFASNFFWNSNEELEKIYEVLIKYIGVPDITFLIKASPEVRRDRIIKRNPSDSDLLDDEKFLYGYDKMEYFLKKFNNPYIVIETDNKTPIEVCDEVKSYLDKLLDRKVLVRK